MKRKENYGPPKPPPPPKAPVRSIFIPIGLAIGVVAVYAKVYANANQVIKSGQAAAKLRPKDSGRWIS